MSWEAALHTFLLHWREREEVIGILLCGSYVTGNASPRSDLDVHIILREEESWRERGNQYVDSYLIEYFANPPRQIRQYFEEDYYDRRPMSMVQFITGKILYDPYGVVEQLKQEAQDWKGKPYQALAAAIIELKKYSLWDMFDNVQDCFEQNRQDADFIYFSALQQLFTEYSLLLNLELIPHDHIYRYLTDTSYLAKYLKASFPDNVFAALYIKAMKEQSKELRLSLLSELLEHVFKRAGGFQIDGWRLHSPVQN